MRFTTPALNNDYLDEDYLRVFGFPEIGKGLRVHRSVVFVKPSCVRLGTGVVIEPFCVFTEGDIRIGDNVTIKAGCYFEGNVSVGNGEVLAPNGVWIGKPITPDVDEGTV